MSQASITRRARLDALLDQGGLAVASAADRAWLAAERARDAEFDREVGALLRAEAHLQEWGAARGGAEQHLDDALAGIFAGIDEGRYDDGLEVDGVPHFADGEGEVVGLAAARPLTSPAGEVAVAASAVAVVPQPAAARPRLLRDGRFMQLLAAAAAVVLVVTAGLTAVSVSSPESSESAAFEPQSPAPASAVAPVTVAPTAPMALEEAQMAPAEPADEPRGPGSQGAPQGATGDLLLGGGYGGRAPMAEATPRPSPTSASTSTASPSAMSAGTSAPVTAELMAMQDDASPPVERPAFAATPVAPAADPAASDAATRGAAARRPGASSADEGYAASRYSTQSAMQAAMNQCVGAPRRVTYEVASGTGLVRVLTAEGATAAELSCLRGVAQRTVVTPAPGVARRQQVTLRSVSHSSAQ